MSMQHTDTVKTIEVPADKYKQLTDVLDSKIDQQKKHMGLFKSFLFDSNSENVKAMLSRIIISYCLQLIPKETD